MNWPRYLFVQAVVDGHLDGAHVICTSVCNISMVGHLHKSEWGAHESVCQNCHGSSV